MFDTVFGLPVHPLVVHATVVLVPLATLLVLVCAIWGRTRRVLAWPAVLASVVAALLVAVAGVSGGPLESRVAPSPLIGHHAQLAKVLAVAVVSMTAAVFVLAYVSWRSAGAPVASWLRLPGSLVRAATPRWLGGLVAVRWILPAAIALSLLTATGTLVATVLVGHSGAQAAWTKVAQTPPRDRHESRR